MGARMPVWNGTLGQDARMRGWNVKMLQWDAKILG